MSLQSFNKRFFNFSTVMVSTFSYLLTRFAPVSLMASTLAIASSVALPIALPCSTVAWAETDQYGRPLPTEHLFGRSAQSGRDGSAGRNGEPGADQTIYVQGRPMRLDLSGRDGEAGRDGEDARRPRCEQQYRNGRYNQRAASGGDGGDGGAGGDGGNGGILTIHYANSQALQQVLVDAGGGKGDRGGRGGQGTNGCNCRVYRWTVEVCDDGICRHESYKCEAGEDGEDGHNGREGSAGGMGYVTLIDQLESLPSESPSQTKSIARLANGEPVNLSRNLWEVRSGARGLLAPGSVVQDDYRAYQGFIERQFSLDWQAPQSPDDLTDEVSLSLEKDGEVEMVFPESYWLLGDTTRQNNATTYRVEGILPIADVTRLAMGRVTGRSRTFEVSAIDQAQLSDELDTQFEVRYSTSRRGGRGYDVKYEGPVPSDLVVRDHNRFTLALGRLPIRSQLMSGGTEARVELIATRSYGKNSTQQTLTWSGRL